MKRPTILVAVDEETLRQRLKQLLLREAWTVIESPGPSGLLPALRKRDVDLVILGPSSGGSREGLDAARQVRRGDRRIPLILVTADSSEELAIAALKTGIDDYFKQPFSDEELARAVGEHLAGAQASSPAERTGDSGLTGAHRMIGESPPMREIKEYIHKVASSNCNVLITGETGTGKELAAELIHENSGRRGKPFVCINCAAIPDSLLESELFGHERGAFTGAHSFQEGKLKLADGGTVFFDEIGDMSSYAQAKILRAIEAKQVERLGGKGGLPVDIRVIAATNRDVESLAKADHFRKDLYFRLNVVRVHLPPLRERKADIPPLLGHYLREFSLRSGWAVEGFTEDTLYCLLRHDWPGNVRELKNLVEAVFVSRPSAAIGFMDLPEPFRRRFLDSQQLSPAEPDRLLYALLSTNWNKSKAAQKLHWSRMTLYRKMAKYRLTSAGKGAPKVGALNV